MAETTWEQTSTNQYYDISTDDIIMIGMLVDSSIVNSDNVTNVQFRFNAAGGSSGTLNCCRWDDLSTIEDDPTKTGASVLALANHTYWSVDVTTISGAGMYGDGVTTSSTPNVAGNIIGFVMTGSGSDTTQMSMEDPVVSGYTTYATNKDGAGSSPKVASKTATFSITTGGGTPTGNGTLLPPPYANIGLHGL